MYFVYILECCDSTFYTGITTNLERRVKEHNTSKIGAKYTKVRRPVKLIYSKEFSNRSEASIEESRIKKLSRIEKINFLKNNV
ncbi:MAG: GIY-YIG nuclease family protein [Candidatus Shapirobacteria bacterium]|nr:GIY-YIG nuclease family protein [Candidatus Shapirobacteria bacterium]